LDEKPFEDRTPRDERNSKGEADAYDKPKARITTQRIAAASSDAIDISSMLTKVPLDALGLFMVNFGDLVLVEQVGEVALGRQAEDSITSVSIDLTPYGGGPLGVSRLHASILIAQDTYLLQDLDSTNGTWLNEERLPPHIPHALESGDLIRLGQVRMYAVFHGFPDQGDEDP
jgi:hypothetical protein